MSKRQLITQKSIELFSQNSIAKTSIQDITDACGISKGAFYLSFRSKEELLIAIVDEFIKELTISFQSLLEEDISARDKLIKFCSSTMILFNQRFPLFEMFLTENLKEMKSGLVEQIELFDKSVSDIILILLKETYGSSISKNRYDIHIVLKGIVQGYTDFILHHRQQYDFDHVARLIVSYIDAIIEKQFDPFISEELFLMESTKNNKHLSIREIIDQEITRCLIEYNGDPFFKESLNIVVKELSTDKPSSVILNGMAANLHKEKELRWLASLLRLYSPLPTL